MSRVGQKAVEIPVGVTVSVSSAVVTAKGPQGELHLNMPAGVEARVDGNKISVTRSDESDDSNRLHGLVRSLIANIVEGTARGFKKELEVQGVGFKAAMQGQTLALSLGFSTPVMYSVPEGVKIVIDGGTQISVSGADKQKVGDVAARIRSFFPAEPYKGKGIRYRGEYVRRKVGKTVA
jgi:large subunit ribosomal protein L6